MDWAVLVIVILHHQDPRGYNMASKKTWIDLIGRISSVNNLRAEMQPFSPFRLENVLEKKKSQVSKRWNYPLRLQTSFYLL